MKQLDYKFLSLALLNSFILLFLFFKTNPPPIEINNQELLQQFSALNTKLIQPAAIIDLDPLKHEVNALREFLHQLHNKSDKQFDERQFQLQQKLNTIGQALQLLDEKQHPMKFLPTSALPFKVIGIDVVQQVPVVSVSFNFKTILLEKDDSLAGWTVVDLSFSKQKVVFKNKNEEHVAITGDKHA
ncbi:MAG: hypothetical protein H0U57_13255 [Tatlockia sp.]|nr:hypothetical protein [Tatlockia sp.]